MATNMDLNATVGTSTSRFRNRPSAEGCGLWTAGEHQRFLQALALYPSGPWRAVAAFVGSRNVRQTMTHAQKHKQKLARHERGLRTRQKAADETKRAKRATSTSTVAVDAAILEADVDAFLRLGGQSDDDDNSFHAPLTAFAPPLSLDKLLQEDDDLVLATPMVADCLDYLVRCFT